MIQLFAVLFPVVGAECSAMSAHGALAPAILIANACLVAACAVDTTIGRPAVRLLVPHNTMAANLARYGGFALADAAGNHGKAFGAFQPGMDDLPVVQSHMS